MIKVEIAKDIHLQMWTFCHSCLANSIKIDLHTCNLHTGQSMNYMSVISFDWICPTRQNVFHIKCQKHLQMDICYFDFCHCRRNAFRIFKLTSAYISWKYHQIVSTEYRAKHCLWKWMDFVNLYQFRSHCALKLMMMISTAVLLGPQAKCPRKYPVTA